MDGVTQFMDPFGLVRGYLAGDVKFVASALSLPFANHGFMSAPYQQALSEGIYKFKERNGL